MKDKTIYAVVDLETTGNSVKNGDRIIQFGCVLVQDKKIINSYSFNVNPESSIPPMISQLTHITGADLVDAPIFAQVADVIHGLLGNTVFVAHNVNFDFPFLNAEFERVGLAPLIIQALDTVELAQVLLPIAPSYRLVDLTSYLNIVHENPHQADSDAMVTAKLFIVLMERIWNLPNETLRLLAKHHEVFTAQTGDLIQRIAQQQPKKELPDFLYEKAGLVLRKKKFPQLSNQNTADKYPLTEEAKKEILMPALKWRRQQAMMMDTIYNNYQNKQMRPMMLEAETGLGKSLGYLLPFSYLISPQKKLVVATTTMLLQNQIANQNIRLLNQLLDSDLVAEIVKSPQHYIDLNRFSAMLAHSTVSDQFKLIQLKIIIWLTMTTTGDLDELHLTVFHRPILNQITHGGLNTLSKEQTFFDDDFLRYLNQKQDIASILVVNQAYLVFHYNDPLFANKPYLVVDEAQHLSNQTSEAYSEALQLSNWHHNVESLINTVNSQYHPNLQNVFNTNHSMSLKLTELVMELKQFSQTLLLVQESLYDQFIYQQIPRTQKDGRIRRTISATNLEHFITEEYLFSALNRMGKKISQSLEQIQLQSKSLVSSINNADINNLVSNHKKLITTFNYHYQQYIQIQNQIKDAQDKGYVFWFSLKNYSDIHSLTIHWQMIETARQLQSIFKYFEAPVFTGATLSADHDFAYLQKELGFSESTKWTQRRFKGPFKYKKQARMYIATDAPDIKTQSEQFLDYTANLIYRMTRNNDRQTMVLFNSLDTIRQIYSRLNETDLGKVKEILAQGTTGSKEKIIKRFELGEQSLLLGSSSFFEGVDFPEKLLEQLILTRLPFDSPDDIIVKAKMLKANNAGENAFLTVNLPTATIRLRQAFGRLIRTTNDRGVFVVLDKRIIETKFGHQMLASLPTSLPKTELNQNQLIADSNQFFES